MPKAKRIPQFKLILLFILCGIIFAVAIFLFLRLHSGVVIKTDKSDLFLNNVPQYRQDDKLWADNLLGASQFTMKSSGCLVSCIASAIGAEKGEEITPGELNKIFFDNNVYDINGNIQWAEIEKLDGYKVQVFDQVSENDIYQTLTAGHHPIVRVRVNGFGNFHYVLIVGFDGNEYVCMDPLKNDFTRLSDYWNIVYAVRVVY